MAFSDPSFFADALRQRSPNFGLLRACQQWQLWLDCPEGHLAREIRAALADTRLARALIKAKPIVSQRLLRDVLPEPAERDAAFQAMCHRLQHGGASEAEQHWLVQATKLEQIASILAESLPRQEDTTTTTTEVVMELLQHLPALQQAMQACGVMRVTKENTRALVAAIEDFRTASEASSPTKELANDQAWWLGMAFYSLGRAKLELGDGQAARAAFVEGATWFDQAGDRDQAADLRQRIEAIDLGRQPSFNRQAADPLRLLQEHQVDAKPLLEIVEALSTLAEATKQTGDRFEVVRLNREIALSLEQAGYPDPETHLDRAVKQWVKTAATESLDVDLCERLTTVARHWAGVMGARAIDRLPDGGHPDAGASARAEACVHQIMESIRQMVEIDTRVCAQLEAELSEWFGGSYQSLVDADGPTPVASTSEMMEGVAINHALFELRLACNKAASEQQLEQVDALIARALTLGSRLHVAQARLERAYVLLALERYADVPDAAEAALRALMGDGQTASAKEIRLAHFSSSAERELYLSARLFTARAYLARQDYNELLNVCRPVIDEIEEQRSEVGAPYQQAAFLSSRVEFYEFAAAAARSLGQMDLLLTTTEQLKASQSWRLGDRHVQAIHGVGDSELADLDAKFLRLNRSLANALPTGRRAEALRAERQLVAEARLALRQRLDRRTPPVMTASAVCHALAPDEAALSWCWLGDRGLLLLVCTNAGVEPLLLKLSDDERHRLTTWVQTVNGLSGEGGDAMPVAAEMNALLDALAPVLLPPSAQARLRDKRRLILSPHRELHLFPFHAITWLEESGSTRWLIESFTVRYAPNLTSLLLPWHGNRSGSIVAVGIANVSDPELATLPHVVDESREIASIHSEAGSVYLGCTRAEFLTLPLATCRCLHLATHASSVLCGDGVDDPQQIAVACSDGWLDGWQLAGLELPAELLVLAACCSGQRAIRGRGMNLLPGDDLLGLQAVFFEAGVGSILGTLWTIEDESAQQFFVALHRHYAKGCTPELALQLTYREQLTDPLQRLDRFRLAPFFLTSARNPNLTQTTLSAMNNVQCLR